MRPPLVVVAAIALAGAIGLAASRPWAAAGSSSTSSATQSGMIALPLAVHAGQMALYGHIKKLVRTGARFELGFDPAWLASGITASRAKLRDTGSSEVPNDSYTVDEGHRLLTYRVPSSARVTVLTNDGTGMSSATISVSELARIINGGPHRKLFEPLASGIWIRVHSDTVEELDQQYQP